MTTPSSSNPNTPRWQDRLLIAIEGTTQALGSVLTLFGAIIFAVVMLILWINSQIHDQSRIPPNAQAEMREIFLISGYLVIPGWALMCVGFGLFPFRGSLFKTSGNTVQ
jgi:hypothetical protein